MEQDSRKRQIAYKVCIKDLLEGEYSKEEGWNPNYVSVSGVQVSRANVAGIVVSVEDQDNFKSVILDDGTGRIGVRVFEDNTQISNLSVGDCAFVIGRPREYGSERYLLGEIVKKEENVDWIKVRKLENKEFSDNDFVKRDEKVEEVELTEESAASEETPAERIIENIKKLDEGEGADFDEVVKGLDNGEKIIKTLMMEGEVFEISPGKLKVLD